MKSVKVIRRRKSSGKLVLTLVLGAAASASAQEISKQTCDGKEPVGHIGISAIACSGCTFSSPGGKPWSFRSEPKIMAMHRNTRAADLLKAGDIITHVNGKPITTKEAAAQLSSLKPGEAVVITVRRNDQSQQLALNAEAACPNDARLPGNYGGVKTAPAPKPAVYGQAPPGFAYRAMPRASFGMGLSCSGSCSISFSETNKTATMKFSEPPEVYSLEKGGPADQAGIRRGDVITHINGRELDSNEGGDLFANIKPGESVKFTIVRDGDRKSISVRASESSVMPPPQLAASSAALDRARETLSELERGQAEQMRRLQEELRRSQQLEQEKLREMQRHMMRAEQEHRSKLSELARELARVDSRMRAAMADSLRPPYTVPPAAPAAARSTRTLRYTGTLADVAVEVRGSNPVSVTETGDEIVITTGGTVVRLKKNK